MNMMKYNNWNTSGYCRNAAGMLLEYCWNTAGINQSVAEPAGVLLESC
jgi:hypothetical protein